MAETGTFTVKGDAGVYGVITITWADGVFDDPSGRVQFLIDAEQELCATPTGPCYLAAAKPGFVALLTAAASLDRVDEIAGPDAAKFQAQLVEECSIPADAVA